MVTPVGIRVNLQYSVRMVEITTEKSDILSIRDVCDRTELKNKPAIAPYQVIYFNLQRKKQKD
jgi:hypothetical protein